MRRLAACDFQGMVDYGKIRPWIVGLRHQRSLLAPNVLQGPETLQLRCDDPWRWKRAANADPEMAWSKNSISKCLRQRVGASGRLRGGADCVIAAASQPCHFAAVTPATAPLLPLNTSALPTLSTELSSGRRHPPSAHHSASTFSTAPCAWPLPSQFRPTATQRHHPHRHTPRRWTPTPTEQPSWGRESHHPRTLGVQSRKP